MSPVMEEWERKAQQREELAQELFGKTYSRLSNEEERVVNRGGDTSSGPQNPLGFVANQVTVGHGLLLGEEAKQAEAVAAREAGSTVEHRGDPSVTREAIDTYEKAAEEASKKNLEAQREHAGRDAAEDAGKLHQENAKLMSKGG
jgi:hypothetical protein